MQRQPLTGLIVCPGIPAAALFDLGTSPDGLTQPWVALKRAFQAHGVDLVGSEQLKGTPHFELHFNVQFPRSLSPKFVLLLENPLIYPANGFRFLQHQYRTIFAWNSELGIDGKTVPIRLPHPLEVAPLEGYGERPQLVVLINSNKALAWWAPDRDLYRERLKAIRWFERYAPQDFALYGRDWDKSPAQPVVGGLIRFLERWWPQPSTAFPSWRGTIAAKRDILLRSRFSIVYENAIFRGYITEKIFDAFCAGNVPVYWGAPDVTDYIPKDCFIDRREFSSYEDLYWFLKTMPEETYLGYQQAIHRFLASPQAQQFSIPHFVQTIVTEIMTHLSR
ncbi:glycosyltransferase family 10 domain-containing protein [Thermosynechococcus sp.]|uniref:glycosyltransferase family 10 domain-containing protein n=1 Tax=Thermosynechococcus sp. TaxID=2814275 RepID=UPI0039193698